MTMLATIQYRTSYRRTYKPTPVPKEDLLQILEAGLAAPSGCNKQTTSLIAVDDRELLCRLYDVIDPKVAETAPAMICVLAQTVYAYGGKSYHVQDYSAAIENMLLAAVALGYQSCWFEGHVTDADAIGRKMADILEVPQDYELVCFLPIGIADQPLTRVEKKPFQEQAWLNGFRKQI